MSLFDFGKPMWFKILPKYFQPPESKIDRLESLRNKYSLGHQTFAKMISMTPYSVVKLQWHVLNKFRKEQPYWSERQLWAAVIESRMNVKRMSLRYPQEPYAEPLNEEQIHNIILASSMVVQDFDTFDKVADFILNLDYAEKRFDEPTGILNEVSKILKVKLSI